MKKIALLTMIGALCLSLIHIDRQDMNDLRILLEKHIKETGSHLAQQILNDFDDWVVKFKKIVPVQYLHMLKSINNFKKIGYSCDEAELKAFQEFYQQEE